MKILFITANLPYDLRTLVHGVYKRMRMFIDAIKEVASIEMLIFVRPEVEISPSFVSSLERSFSEYWNIEIKVFLCPTTKFQQGSTFLKRLGSYASGSLSYFRQPNSIGTSGQTQVRAFESCLWHHPDAIFVHKLPSMNPLLLTKENLPPVFFDLDDIEHIVLKRSLKNTSKWYEKILCYSHLPQLFWGELRATRLAKNTFVCSDVDRRYLTNRFHQESVVAIPNAITIPKELPLTNEPTMLFIGSYGYKPNIDAAEFLLQKIFPRIAKVIPAANLIIAGAKSENIRGYKSGIPGVTFTGFVDDLELLYRKTKIVCTPIFTGGGTRVKIIEAAAYGKPIIATRIGAEGIELRDGHEILIRDNEEEFIEACLLLLRDTTLCERLGAAARARAIQLYDRENVVKLIQKYLTNENECIEVSSKL